MKAWDEICYISFPQIICFNRTKFQHAKNKKFSQTYIKAVTFFMTLDNVIVEWHCIIQYKTLFTNYIMFVCVFYNIPRSFVDIKAHWAKQSPSSVIWVVYSLAWPLCTTVLPLTLKQWHSTHTYSTTINQHRKNCCICIYNLLVHWDGGVCE